MKRGTLLISKIGIIMLLIITLAGCNRDCNCYNDFTPLPLSEKYFKYYKDENQSWVYTNRQGTKKDSIYLTYDWYDRENGPDINTTTCNISYSWNMILHSKYILKDTVLCQYSSGGVRKDGKVLWWSTELSIFSRQNLEYGYIFISEYGVDTMRVSSNVKKYLYVNESILLPNNKIYNTTININNTLWFAPDVGLIQFVSYNKVDTFYLQKFYRK